MSNFIVCLTPQPTERFDVPKWILEISPQCMIEIPPIPPPLFSCNLCREDYSWPPADLFWSVPVKAWICVECWEPEAHGKRTICLNDLVTVVVRPK
jgi:hypothetical protein